MYVCMSQIFKGFSAHQFLSERNLDGEVLADAVSATLPSIDSKNVVVATVTDFASPSTTATSSPNIVHLSDISKACNVTYAIGYAVHDLASAYQQRDDLTQALNAAIESNTFGKLIHLHIHTYIQTYLHTYCCLLSSCFLYIHTYIHTIF